MSRRRRTRELMCSQFLYTIITPSEHITDAAEWSTGRRDGVCAHYRSRLLYVYLRAFSPTILLRKCACTMSTQYMFSVLQGNSQERRYSTSQSFKFPYTHLTYTQICCESVVGTTNTKFTRLVWTI